MADAEYEYVDNSEEIAGNMKDAIQRALKRIGLQAESFAKKLCPVDTGGLRNSINHKIHKKIIFCLHFIKTIYVKIYYNSPAVQL